MASLEYILFICVTAPLFLMFLLIEGRPKLAFGYMIIGIVTCLFASELNSILLEFFDYDYVYMTTVITPITEEILKAIPILFYAKVYSDKKRYVLMISFALGIGFGMFENMVILVQNMETVTLGWAVIRGFSTALMHGMCTYMVGFGITFINKRRKMFFSGIFALLTFASIYHGIFNMLQLNNKYLGACIPILTYLPVLIVRRMRVRQAERNAALNAAAG